MIEIWKNLAEIEGMEQYGNYEVSNFGNVRSLNYNHTSKPKLLKPVVNTCGYLRVSLCSNGKRKTFKIHRLVALAFIPNPDNLPQVNHKDENKQNNNVNNLEWCTAEYNINYGTHNERISKKVYCVENGKVYDSVTESAKELNIDIGYISGVLTGRCKTTHGYHFEYYNK